MHSTPQIHAINLLLIYKIVNINIYSNDGEHDISRINTIRVPIMILWLNIELISTRITTHIDNLWIIIKVLDISYTKRWVVRLRCSCIEIMQLCIFYKIWTWMVIKSALEPILVDFGLASFNFLLVLSS